jgi:serpin B
MKQIINTLIGAMLLVGCNSSTTSSNIDIKSKLKRDLNPDVTQSELTQLVRDNNKFAYSLFENLDSREESTFFSPISITHALMMSYAGASNNTKQEMKTALNITLADDRIHESFNKLDLGLNFNEKTDIFKIANSIWPSKDFKFEQSYLDSIMVNYGASLKTLDFTHKPEDSRKTINRWVEENTEDKIKDLIPKGAIDSMTKMVLSNATYFKGEWEHTFDPKNTKEGFFNDDKKIQFMNQTEVFSYFEDENIQAIKLTYKTRKNSMIILMPKTESFIPTTFDIDEKFKKYRVTLKMPKFEFTSTSISLKKTMVNLGMKDAFVNGVADFTIMDKSRSLYISDILHKAFIKVDEQGTEAAAATAVLLKNTGFIEVPTANFTIDKPFYYVIVDDESGQILFIGHFIKP